MDKEKIKSCLIGYAIGDALGIGTEFMSRAEVRHRYPDGLTRYDQIIRDAHRSQWPRGCYTADTEQLIQLITSLLETGKPDYMHFAKTLKRWFDATEGQDAGPHIRLVIQHEHYLDNPHEAARDIYSKRKYFEAHNESLGRAMLLGLWPGTADEIEQYIADNVKTTHYDTRCTTASVIIGIMAHELMYNSREASYDQLAEIALRRDKRVLPYLVKAFNGQFDDFELDDEESLWFTRKTMGAALWILLHHDDPEKALYDIVAAGGDADTNAALALGLMALKHGKSALPPHLIDGLKNKDELLELADKLCELIDSIHNS